MGFPEAFKGPSQSVEEVGALEGCNNRSVDSGRVGDFSADDGGAASAISNFERSTQIQLQV